MGGSDQFANDLSGDGADRLRLGFFYYDLSDADSFPALKVRTTRIFQFSSFAAQASAGTLPTYSFLCPQMNEGKDGSQPNSQHAPYDVRLGENLIADVY